MSLYSEDPRRKIVKPEVLGAGYQAGPDGLRAYFECYGIDPDSQTIVNEWRNLWKRNNYETE